MARAVRYGRIATGPLLFGARRVRIRQIASRAAVIRSALAAHMPTNGDTTNRSARSSPVIINTLGGTEHYRARADDESHAAARDTECDHHANQRHDHARRRKGKLFLNLDFIRGRA